jgi:hypothetical protein
MTDKVKRVSKRQKPFVASEMVREMCDETGAGLEAARLYKLSFPVRAVGVALYPLGHYWHGGSRTPVHFIPNDECRKMGIVPRKGRGLQVPNSIVREFVDGKLTSVPGNVDWEKLRYSCEIFGYDPVWP